MPSSAETPSGIRVDELSRAGHARARGRLVSWRRGAPPYGHTVAFLLGYLALLTAAELAVTFVNPVLVFPLHGGLIGATALGLVLLERQPAPDAPSRALAGLLLALILAPLIRIISLTLPLPQIDEAYRYLFAGVPMALGAVLVARYAGLRWQQMGLVWRAWRWQVLAIVVSVGLGILEFFILRPPPLGVFPWLPSGLLPALSVGLFTGFPEELIFRGIIQTALRPVLGAWNVVFASAIFAILHIGYTSLIDLVFVFTVGLIYGWIFERSRSIIGISIGHGVANVVLFFVAPYLIAAA